MVMRRGDDSEFKDKMSKKNKELTEYLDEIKVNIWYFDTHLYSCAVSLSTTCDPSSAPDQRTLSSKVWCKQLSFHEVCIIVSSGGHYLFIVFLFCFVFFLVLFHSKLFTKKPIYNFVNFACNMPHSKYFLNIYDKLCCWVQLPVYM